MVILFILQGENRQNETAGVPLEKRRLSVHKKRSQDDSVREVKFHESFFPPSLNLGG